MRLIISIMIAIFSMTAIAENKLYPLFVADNGIKVYGIESDKKLISFTINPNFEIIDVITEDRKPNDKDYLMYCWVKPSEGISEINFKNKTCVSESGNKEIFSNKYDLIDPKIVPQYYTKRISANTLRVHPHREKFKIDYLKNNNKVIETYIYYTLDPMTGNTFKNRKYIFTNK